MTPEQNSLVMWMIWFHAAVLLLPVAIFMTEIEWLDLRENMRRSLTRRLREGRKPSAV